MPAAPTGKLPHQIDARHQYERRRKSAMPPCLLIEHCFWTDAPEECFLCLSPKEVRKADRSITPALATWPRGWIVEKEIDMRSTDDEVLRNRK